MAYNGSRTLLEQSSLPKTQMVQGSRTSSHLYKQNVAYESKELWLTRELLNKVIRLDVNLNDNSIKMKMILQKSPICDQ